MKENLTDAFIADSFKDDIRQRELRLSKQEMQYIRKRFPRAHIKPVKDQRLTHTVKEWYTVSLHRYPDTDTAIQKFQ